MKKNVAAFLLSGALTVAGFLSMSNAHGAEIDAVDLCDRMGAVAFTLMVARQNGVDKEVFMKSKATTRYSAGIIRRAWDKPINPDVIERSWEARSFERDEVKLCLKHYSI